jgi:hypothetical protein
MAYHTYALTGAMWVLELLEGHPEHSLWTGCSQTCLSFPYFLPSANRCTTLSECFSGAASHFLV